MELNEIRLGNKILHDGKVYYVDAKMMYAFFSGNLDYDISKFDPIALTEEWLLKFGFQRHDEGSVSAQFSYGTNPVTQDYLIYLKWIKDYENDYQLNGFPFYQNGHFEIKTVHQLQNFFHSLTGEELEISADALQ